MHLHKRAGDRPKTGRGNILNRTAGRADLGRTDRVRRRMCRWAATGCAEANRCGNILGNPTS